MSCGGRTQTFRLLDQFVGWDEADRKGLDGFSSDDAEGLRLAQIDRDAVHPSAVLAYISPPRLARGCDRCDWFLVDQSRLLRRDCCAPNWLPVWSEACDWHLLINAVAVAYRNHRVAVSDPKAKRIWIWEREGEQLTAAINCDQLVSDIECDRPDAVNRIVSPGPLAFTPWGELLAADSETKEIWRFGPAGEVRGKLSIVLPSAAQEEEINRLAVSDDCSIWIVTRTKDDSLKLWRAERGDKEFAKASIEQLQKSFKPKGLTAASDEGFCIEECGKDGLPATRCFDWHGEPLQAAIAPLLAPLRHKQGQLLTHVIDSGIPRCLWHRARIDADVPSGTMISVEVASSENLPDSKDEAIDEEIQAGDWKDFKAGVPNSLDWKGAHQPGALDFLIEQPPGRYLYLRMRLKGDGRATPIVRRVRLDFPRVTSLDYLPPVYRDNPEAEDFTERFLSLFDATIADLDRAIERAPALLDSEGAPDDLLPWIGSFLDVVFDPAWSPDLRRKILRELPELYRRRGTIAGLAKTVKLIFGVEPAIQELAAERNWGGVAKRGELYSQNGFRLGASRLFGRSRSRFRLNSSQLGNAPIRSYGNPDHDPLMAHVFRLRVLIPPLNPPSADARERLEQLILSQKPAHAVAEIRFGGEGFILGVKSAVGIDTAIAPPLPPVLGKAGNIRLNRMSVLRPARSGARKGMLIGETSIVGVQTIVE